ncbi:hypothetical protein CLIB1423_15S02124 [[Candida] railenensis]|uniref:Uncharacterized protein n=1 Tax=[Candida] railenensis TaxID=45579 RepID=A0A9P0VZS1_9ASCO|nr:hypothetical protein CLIB1423_15S02124 [[Candida] railenensis]
MLFTIFRFILIFWTIVQLLLAVFALVSSYKKVDYLTKFYLIDFYVADINLASIFPADKFQKRDAGAFGENPVTTTSAATTKLSNNEVVTTTLGDSGNTIAAADGYSTIVYYSPITTVTMSDTTLTSQLVATTTASSPAAATEGGATTWDNGYYYPTTTADTLVDTASTTAGTIINGDTSAATSTDATLLQPTTTKSLGASTSSSSSAVSSTTYAYGSLQETINNLDSTYSFGDLGFADVYSVSYWGYCRGSADKTTTIKNGVSSTSYDNSNVNFTWCSKPKASYVFDPATVIKAELNNTLATYTMSDTVRSQLEALRDNLNSSNIELPGNLDKKFATVKSLVKASFGLLVATVALTSLSLVIGLLGCYLSPGNCMLSFINFLFQFAIFVINIIAAGLITGMMLYVKSQVNDVQDTYGAEAHTTVGFYGFIWSAAAAGWLVVCFSLLGHCLGLFNTKKHRRKYYRTIVEKD